MNKVTHAYPTRFNVTSTERVARIYVRFEGDANLYELTTKTPLLAGFEAIMKRASRLSTAVASVGYNALYTIGFTVTVNPLGENVSYWTTVNTPSALGTEPTHEAKAPRPKLFNNYRSFYAMDARLNEGTPWNSRA